jgi:nucleotide-binding universal stress UspA family protein
VFKKILVALDGSQLAEGVLPYTTDLATRFNSHVHLVSVISDSERGQGLDRVFDAYLSRVTTNFKENGSNAKTTLLFGNPTSEILNYSEKHGIDLITLTSLGKGGVGRWNLGSVAEKISEASKSPVLLVPVNGGKQASGPFFTRILVPVDISDLGGAALPCVFAIGPKANSSVTLLYVESKPYTPTELSRKYYTETAEYLRKGAREYLDKTARELKTEGVEAIYDIVSGDPAEEILNYAVSKKSDLIAISTHGRSGIVRWALGSVANKVLHSTVIPLLLVRAAKAACPAMEAN